MLSGVTVRQHDDVRFALLAPVLASFVGLSASSARAEPVYFGAASRGGVDPAAVQKMRASLERAVAKQGVKVLESATTGEEDAQTARAQARSALDDATQAFADEDWASSLTASLIALQKFEAQLAYSEEEAAWDMLEDIHALRALTYLKIRKKNDAADSMRALLVVLPKYMPNRERAPAELIQLVDDVKDEIASMPPAPLEVQSKPAGAQVLVDGRRRGKAPLLIEDLAAGVHYVALVGNGGRHVERLVVDEVGARVSARIGSRKGVAARDVLRAIEKPTTAKAFVAAVQGVDDDGLLAVIVPAGKRVEVIGARVVGGEVKLVCGIRVPDNDNDRDRAAFVLVEGLLEKDDDAWLDEAKGDDASSLRQRLFAGMGTFEVPPEEEDTEPTSPAVVAAGIVVGVLVVAVTGTAVGISVARELKKNEGFTWGVNTTRFQPVQ